MLDVEIAASQLNYLTSHTENVLDVVLTNALNMALNTYLHDQYEKDDSKSFEQHGRPRFRLRQTSLLRMFPHLVGTTQKNTYFSSTRLETNAQT